MLSGYTKRFAYSLDYPDFDQLLELILVNLHVTGKSRLICEFNYTHSALCAKQN